MGEKVTNEKLAGLIESVATTLTSFQQETREAISDLQKGTFTFDEKERILAVVDVIDQRLEDETIGIRDITLTRREYDATSVASGFANRFKKPADLAVD